MAWFSTSGIANTSAADDRGIAVVVANKEVHQNKTPPKRGSNRLWNPVHVRCWFSGDLGLLRPHIAMPRLSECAPCDISSRRIVGAALRRSASFASSLNGNGYPASFPYGFPFMCVWVAHDRSLFHTLKYFLSPTRSARRSLLVREGVAKRKQHSSKAAPAIRGTLYKGFTTAYWPLFVCG